VDIPLSRTSKQWNHPVVLLCVEGFGDYDAAEIIYGASCVLGRDRLQAERIIVRQTHCEITLS
jgi:hypothetical protein